MSALGKIGNIRIGCLMEGIIWYPEQSKSIFSVFSRTPRVLLGRGHAILCAFLGDESPPPRLDSGRQVRPGFSCPCTYIHAYARAYACLPIMRIARVRLHVYPTRDGRAPAYVRRAPSRRVGSLSLPPFSRFAPGKVMSSVHWAPIDKGRRSSTFLSPVSPPPASESAIYIARRFARAGDGITSPRTCLELLPCTTHFLPLFLFSARLPFRVPRSFLTKSAWSVWTRGRAKFLKSGGRVTGIFQSFWL